jgi:hypothetical protein
MLNDSLLLKLRLAVALFHMEQAESPVIEAGSPTIVL